MQRTAATGQTSGTRRWMRTVLLTAGLALLVSTAPAPAGAEENDARDSAKYQAAGCALTGGEAEVSVEYDVDLGEFVSHTKCNGGLLDGVECDNLLDVSICAKANVPSESLGAGPWQLYEIVPTWTISEVITVFETGSEAQFHELLADLEDAETDGPVVAPLVDKQDHAQDTHDSKAKKGKKGKHGKKGGKHRRR